MEGRTDERLVMESRTGDFAAFKVLVDRYNSKVAGVVKSMLGDTSEAVDVGQEVFIRFYESIHKFKGEASIGTYLVRIAINLSLNELKKRKRRTIFFMPAAAGDKAVAPDNGADLVEIVHYEISRLEPEFRSVVTLRMIEGYSTDETSEILAIPVGTVLSRLSRAQKKLKAVFTNYYQL